MNNYLIDTNSTRNAIIESRNFYEVEQSLENSSTNYGKIANIILYNLPYIDSFAEHLGNYISSKYVLDLLHNQYYDDNHKLKSFMKRNIYVDQVESQQMYQKRFLKGVASNLITQMALKSVFRGVHYLLEEKEKNIIFSEIDSLLKYYTYNNLKNEICNQNMAKIELKKIESTFPINNKELNKISIPQNIDSLNLNTIGNLDDALEESISYLIYSIHMQKYGENSNLDEDIIELYSLLGYNYNLSKELLRENNEIYNKVTTDQKKILNISRSLFRSTATEFPNIDMNSIKNKSIEMAAFDPYIQRRKMTSQIGKSAGITLAGIFVKEPSLVIHGCATGLSIFNIDDDSKELIRKKLLKNSLDSNTIDEITMRSQLIHNKSINDNM